MVLQQAALLSLRFVPFLAFVPVCSHISLLSYLRMPHPPAWLPACGLPMGGGGFTKGPSKGEKGCLGSKIFLGFGAAQAHGGGGELALTRRTGGGGGGGVWR